MIFPCDYRFAWLWRRRQGPERAAVARLLKSALLFCTEAFASLTSVLVLPKSLTIDPASSGHDVYEVRTQRRRLSGRSSTPAATPSQVPIYLIGAPLHGKGTPGVISAAIFWIQAKVSGDGNSIDYIFTEKITQLLPWVRAARLRLTAVASSPPPPLRCSTFCPATRQPSPGGASSRTRVRRRTPTTSIG